MNICFYVSSYQFEVKVAVESAKYLFDVFKTKIYQAFQASIHHLIQLHPRSFIKDNEAQLGLKKYNLYNFLHLSLDKRIFIMIF